MKGSSLPMSFQQIIHLSGLTNGSHSLDILENKVISEDSERFSVSRIGILIDVEVEELCLTGFDLRLSFLGFEVELLFTFIHFILYLFKNPR